MKSSYRKQYRRDDMARPSSYATGFVIPRHASDPGPKQSFAARAPLTFRDRAPIASTQPVALERRTHRIGGGRANRRRGNPLGYAEAVAKIASIALTAGNGVLLTLIFG